MNTSHLYPFLLDPQDVVFPRANLALNEPNGLLAIGGNLSAETLYQAYQQGIFPWYNKGEPILWWSPDPRSVLIPEQLKVSKSLRKLIRKNIFTITYDQAFQQVIRACSSVPREDQGGTWITDEMLQAYGNLHQRGIAHSIECWQGDKLVGGLYGVAIGQVFFGESMFSKVSNASKVALVYLVEQLLNWGYALIDCQIESAHLNSLGAVCIKRNEFLTHLNRYCTAEVKSKAWLNKDNE